MTADERAEELTLPHHSGLRSRIAAAIREAEVEATAAERERCARLAEGVVDCDCMTRIGFCECYGASQFTHLATAIREAEAAAVASEWERHRALRNAVWSAVSKLAAVDDPTVAKVVTTLDEAIRAVGKVS